MEDVLECDHDFVEYSEGTYCSICGMTLEEFAEQQELEEDE